MAKFNQLMERLYRSRWTWIAIDGVAAVLLLVGGTFNALAGQTWVACFNFFGAGFVTACIFFLIFAPFKIHDISEKQRAHHMRELQQIIHDSMEEAKRQGVLPESAFLEPPDRLN